MQKTLAIFAPARLDSQRLPHKQLLPLNHSNMFDMCCQKLEYITTVYNIPTYVLICDEPLIAIAKNYPHVKIIERDIETSKVDGPLKFIYKDVLDIQVDYLMFLNPCLTFLTVETIVQKVKEFLASNKDYGTAVKSIKNWIWDNNGKQITEIDFQALNTKTITPWYQAAHCFHIFNRKKFQEDGYMLKEDLCLLEIPEAETIDIDTREEYEFAKWKWEH